MNQHPSKRRKPSHDERGSITVWAVVASFCMVLVVGIAADLAGHASAEQRARSVAFEAARTAGQQLALDPLATDGTITADPGKAVAAATTYLSTAGVRGTATVAGTTITVRVDDSYTCQFLSLAGISTLPVHGSADVEIHRVMEGRPR